MKKIIITAITITLSVLLLSCAKGKETVNPYWYVVALDEPVTLNPVTASGAYASTVYSYVFDGLINIDRDLKPIPELAKSWDVSSDKLVYTFYLRDDVYWHDGEKFSAEDVKFTYDKIMDPRSKAVNKRAGYKDVKKVQIVDEHTIKFILKEASPDALINLTMTVIPKHIFDNLENYEGEKEYAPALYVLASTSFNDAEKKTQKEVRDKLTSLWKDAVKSAALTDDAQAELEIIDNVHNAEYAKAVNEEGEGLGGDNADADYKEKIVSALMLFKKSVEKEGVQKYIEGMRGKRLLVRPTFLNNKFNRAPVGTGPYRFVEWKSKQHIILEKITNHWRDDPEIKKIKFKFILESAMRLNAYEKGDIDGIAMTPDQWVKNKEKPSIKKKSQLLMYPRLSFAYIGWNMNGSNPFFKDKRVRRAMTHATPRKEITETILHGYAKVLTGPFHPDLWAYDKSIKPYELDLDKAKALLDEAGWIDKDKDGIREKVIDGEKVNFEFEILYGEKSETGEAVLLLLRENLEKIGVKLDLHSLEWSTFSARVHNQDFEAALLAWSLSILPGVYELFHSSMAENGLNYYSYSNPKADRLMELTEKEFNKEKRKAYFHELHKIIHEDQPYTFMWTSLALVALHKRFENVKTSPVGISGYYPGVYAWTINTNY